MEDIFFPLIESFRVKLPVCLFNLRKQCETFIFAKRKLP